MPTLRRILKYTPVWVLGLLVVAWVVSLFVTVAINIRLTDQILWHRLELGSFYVIITEDFPFRWTVDWWIAPAPPHKRYLVLGWSGAKTIASEGAGEQLYVSVAIPVLLTALLPFAIGPFISFRFRLWHYLAYTALVAVELAYYLRWQE